MNVCITSSHRLKKWNHGALTQNTMLGEGGGVSNPGLWLCIKSRWSCETGDKVKAL